MRFTYHKQVDPALAMWMLDLDFDFQLTIWPREKCVGCKEICTYTSLLEFDFRRLRSSQTLGKDSQFY